MPSTTLKVQLGNLVDGLADGQAVVGEHDELGASVAHLVRHVERAAGERDGLERLAAEDVPDAVVELGAGLGRVDVLLLASDHHAQVGLGQEPQRRRRRTLS